MRLWMPGVLSLSFLLAGCASGGTAGNETPSVPVFGPDEETPCEYELLATVTVEVSPLVADRRVEEELKKELGKEGARRGADAVIMEDRFKLPLTVVKVDMSASRPMPREGPKMEGKAVRWIPETCKG